MSMCNSDIVSQQFNLRFSKTNWTTEHALLHPYTYWLYSPYIYTPYTSRYESAPNIFAQSIKPQQKGQFEPK